MKHILQTRFIHWKKQWITLLFWLLFPIAITLVIIQTTNAIQEDTKVPVGIVLEEETPLALELIESIQETPLIRVHQLSNADALHQLQKHKLDSVFIIRKGYEEQIRKGSRNHLITSYKSDLSLAYSPVKEMIISYAQQEAGRSKAAYAVKQLREQYHGNQQWTWKEIVEKSKQIQKEENLLHTTFSFANTETQSASPEITVWKTWGLWSVFTILATLLLFDWLVKERRSDVVWRFTFMRLSFPNYLLKNLVLYTILLLIFDMVALGMFHIFLDEVITLPILGAVLFYRLMVNLGAFLLALCFENTYLFYSVSFVVTLFIATLSGAILPIEGITNRYHLLELVNPLHDFLLGEIGYRWLLVFVILIAIWYVRKEKANA